MVLIGRNVRVDIIDLMFLFKIIKNTNDLIEGNLKIFMN